MATAPQLFANRENALHSTGPRTAEGKSRSAANATRHGLSGGFSVLSSESQDDFDKILGAYQAEFEPQGEHESFLVAQLATSRWRLLRIDRLEYRAFEQALDSPGATDPDSAILNHLASSGSGVINLLQRYRIAAEKSYFKAHRELTLSRARVVKTAASEIRIENAQAERELMEYLMAPPPFLRNEPNSTAPAAARPNHPVPFTGHPTNIGGLKR